MTHKSLGMEIHPQTGAVQPKADQYNSEKGIASGFLGSSKICQSQRR
jgi:hypothetical protein